MERLARSVTDGGWIMSMWKLESHVNGKTVTTVLASLKIAYFAISSLRGQRCSHIITRMK